MKAVYKILSGRLSRDRRIYGPGDEIFMTPEEAKSLGRWIELEAIKEAAPEEPEEVEISVPEEPQEESFSFDTIIPPDPSPSYDGPDPETASYQDLLRYASRQGFLGESGRKKAEIIAYIKAHLMGGS